MTIIRLNCIILLSPIALSCWFLNRGTCAPWWWGGQNRLRWGHELVSGSRGNAGNAAALGQYLNAGWTSCVPFSRVFLWKSIPFLKFGNTVLSFHLCCCPLAALPYRKVDLLNFSAVNSTWGLHTFLPFMYVITSWRLWTKLVHQACLCNAAAFKNRNTCAVDTQAQTGQKKEHKSFLLSWLELRVNRSKNREGSCVPRTHSCAWMPTGVDVLSNKVTILRCCYKSTVINSKYSPSYEEQRDTVTAGYLSGLLLAQHAFLGSTWEQWAQADTKWEKNNKSYHKDARLQNNSGWFQNYWKNYLKLESFSHRAVSEIKKVK